ncbi:hypothetical protein [Anaerocellum danielii]|uniref:Uncharacterized protein n=1 Tax=Anaerocellum danielii TaxID=1387557 RepID=A0ABZ0U0P6_9FIRM|nr:hypothetical protein [Caldicellulosiruptor danielii]WPX08188.1 hypothetical protein SOJ16_002054 [Caldicellulosiruptor danielii]
MAKQVIEELIENLIYDAVYEHRENLENNSEWNRVKSEFEALSNEVKTHLCANTSSAEAERKMEKLFGELLDRHVYLVNLAELNAYRNGFQDGARLVLVLLSGQIFGE